MCITNSPPTEQAYGELQQAFAFLNNALFDGKLPPCLLTLQRKSRRIYGYFARDRFTAVNGGNVDEIALNPMLFRERPVIDVLSTLAHEMAHEWQQHFGKPSRTGYHNREWAGVMLRKGLYPSSTGQPGGQRTGQTMSHYIIPGGVFERAGNDLLSKGFAITWADATPVPPPVQSPLSRTHTGERMSFQCPGCPARAWGKSSLHLICGTCEQQMLPSPPRR